MGETTEIAWCNSTFNPWHGCQRVSPGCQNCYAEAFSKRIGLKIWGAEAPRRFFGESHWEEPRKWNAAAEKVGERRRVFCSSMADVFENRYDLDEQRARLWALIDATPWLDWLLLTKRPENMKLMVPRRWAENAWPFNVWAGTTAEDQKRYDERWPWLANVPAIVRFVSIEPQLERIELRCNGCGHDTSAHLAPDQGGCSAWFPNWVITGGESGHGARPYLTAWARDLLVQCKGTPIKCFVKQMGAHCIDGVGITCHISHVSTTVDRYRRASSARAAATACP